MLSTLDTLKVRTADGLVPLSNFISRQPVKKLAQIDRVDQSRYFDIKADVIPGLTNADGAPMNANERIAALTAQAEAAAVPGRERDRTADVFTRAEYAHALAAAGRGGQDRREIEQVLSVGTRDLDVLKLAARLQGEPAT